MLDVNRPPSRVATDRKGRLKLAPQPMPKQPVAIRVSNWREVNLPWDLATAALEANRCIQCPAAPCVRACPLHNDIPLALQHLENGQPLAASAVFRQTNPLPDMCGRLCPQERLCEGACVVGKVSRPVAIGRLESFSADHELSLQGREIRRSAGFSGTAVAIVGSGPAGLACAEQLLVRGHRVSVFDSWPRAGGLLRYGIPTFKLEKHRVDLQIDYLERLGARFVYNLTVGRDVGIAELQRSGFPCIILCQGAGSGRKLGVPGETLAGVHQATEFLVRTNLESAALPLPMQAPLDVRGAVLVIGGGDTAMDCARSAIRAGAEQVLIAYRRGQEEMRGRAEERIHATEEGVGFRYMIVPTELISGASGTGLGGVRIQQVRPVVPGQLGLAMVPGTSADIDTSLVVMAIGYTVDDLLTSGRDALAATQSGTVAVDPSTGATSRPGVFAAGDSVRGPDLVVTALAQAKLVADAVHEYLT